MGHITKMVTKKSQNRELTEEEYSLYILITLFDAHYLPWLKECYTSQYENSFADRYANLISNMEMASPALNCRKSLIQDIAKNNCFRFQRKLQLTIDCVTVQIFPSSLESDANVVYSVNRTIMIRFQTKDVNEKNSDNSVVFYNCSKVIQIEENFMIFLEIPVIKRILN